MTDFGRYRLSALVLGLLLCTPCSLALAPSARSYGLPQSNASSIANVMSFGASGDGASDDTAAFDAAVAYLLGQPALAHGGVLYVPAGTYRITSTIMVPTSGAFTIQGDGWVSNIVWDSASNLFQWPSAAPASNMLIQDVLVSVPSSWGPSAAPLFAFSFPGGLTQSLLRHIKIENPSYKAYGVSGIDMGPVSDTNEVVSCVFWLLTGTGIRIGRGSEIRVSSGRVISLGALQSPAGSIGVHVTGNNGSCLAVNQPLLLQAARLLTVCPGGVHVVSTDVIGWNRGIVLDSSNGQGSNREVFINQATIDSNNRGLAVYDNSYIDITGCWAASSVSDNIWTHPSSAPQLVITGGTIFNAGAYGGGDCANSDCNGITMNGGSLTMTGVAVRNNQGRGIWVPNTGVSSLQLTGLKIFQNGVAGIDIIAPLSNGFMITSCFAFQNKMSIPSDPQSLVSNNLFK